MDTNRIGQRINERKDDHTAVLKMDKEMDTVASDEAENG